MNDNEPSVLSTSDLAKRWRCSRNSVLALIHAGELAAFKITAKNYRVTLAEVKRFESKRAA